MCQGLQWLLPADRGSRESLLWQLFCPNWCECSLFFAWMYQFPTANLNAYPLLSWSPSKCVSCIYTGIIINLSWLHFPSLPICIYYYPFFKKKSFKSAVLSYTVLSFPWLRVNSLFLPSAIDPTKCFSYSSNFVTSYKCTA